MRRHIEHEVRLVARDPSVLAAAARLREVAGFRLTSRRRERQRNTYFDGAPEDEAGRPEPGLDPARGSSPVDERAGYRQKSNRGGDLTRGRGNPLLGENSRITVIHRCVKIESLRSDS